MKGQIILLLSACGILFSGSCNKGARTADVPSVVLNSLSTRYPNAINVEWEKENNGYEAEFGPADAEVTVHIAPSGKILRQKSALDAATLPAPVRTKVQTEFSDGRIEDAEKVEANGLTYYQLELDQKGKQDTYLVLDADGNAQTDIPYWD